jgi:hypothetical protein
MKTYLAKLTALLALGTREAQCFCVTGDDATCRSDPNRSSSSTAVTTTTTTTTSKDIPSPEILSRRSLVQTIMKKSSLIVVPVTTSMIFFSLPQEASARLESVNRPDLLPSEKGLNVIQTERFLTPGQARRLNEMLTSLEKDTGFRVKVLCQNYPNTPGLAIRDYWSLGKEDQLDDKFVVLVVDQFGGRGNSLNFNVGDVSTGHLFHGFCGKHAAQVNEIGISWIRIVFFWLSFLAILSHRGSSLPFPMCSGRVWRASTVPHFTSRRMEWMWRLKMPLRPLSRVFGMRMAIVSVHPTRDKA